MVTLSWCLIDEELASEWLSEKIGRWSDRSLIIRPLSQLAELSFISENVMDQGRTMRRDSSEIRLNAIRELKQTRRRRKRERHLKM